MILLLAAFLLAPHWVKVQDGYKVHERYVVKEHDRSIYMVGEYYELIPFDFVAKCATSEPHNFIDLRDARDYVEACPQ